MKKLLAITLCLLNGLTAQTTFTYGQGCGGGGCTVVHYPSNRNSANDPVWLYWGGGGWVMNTVGCPQIGVGASMCVPFTDLTNHNFHVWAPNYTGSPSNGSGPFWPVEGQDVACFLSEAVTKGWPGNWNQVIIAGDSAGAQMAGVIGAANQGKYLLSNSNCPSANINWNIIGVMLNSAPPDMPNFASINSSTLFAATYLFGGNPLSGGLPASRASDATIDNYLTQWASRGGPHIVKLTGSEDVTVPTVNQALLPPAIASLGYSANLTELLITGYGHTLDNGLQYVATGDSWPSALLTDNVHQTTAFCDASPNGGPEAIWRVTTTGNTTNGSASITNVGNVSQVATTATIAGPGIPFPSIVGTGSSGSTVNIMSITRGTQVATATATGVTITIAGQNPSCGMLGYVKRAWDLFLPRHSASSGGSDSVSGSW